MKNTVSASTVSSSLAIPLIALWRPALLLLILGGALAALFSHPPIPQLQGYYDFADQRTATGIPNFNDVISNLPFLLVGLAGLPLCRRRAIGRMRAAWTAFAAGLCMVAFGSAWFHLAPSDASLVWDRLPMTTAFLGLFIALLGEYLDLKSGTGRRLLYPVLLLGGATVLYWRLCGDLRPYLSVQVISLLSIPLLLVLYRHRFARPGWLLAGLAAYACAFASERLDGAIFAFTQGLISGHTLKHMLAAAGCAAVLLFLHDRQSGTKTALSRV